MVRKTRAGEDGGTAGAHLREALGYGRPRTYEELRAVLSSASVRLPRQLRRVAVYLAGHPSDVALDTAVGIAGQAGVQPSTLVRFAQSLGFPGFSDLQELFKDYVKTNWPEARGAGSPAVPAAPAGDPDARVLTGLVGVSRISLAGIPERVDLPSFATIASLMADADTIYLVGSKRAFPVTLYMALALSQLSIRNSLVDNVGSIAFEQIGFASPRDVVLAVSFSPYNSITPALAAAAAQSGAAVLTITDGPASPLLPISRASLEIEEAEYGGFRSLSATMAVGLALVLAVSRRRQTAGASRGARPGGGETPSEPKGAPAR